MLYQDTVAGGIPRADIKTRLLKDPKQTLHTNLGGWVRRTHMYDGKYNHPITDFLRVMSEVLQEC